jgi:hypothetical protein
MAKVIKLNIKPDFDFILIALISSEPLYRVSWLINEHFNTQLKEAEPIHIIVKKREINQSFQRFAFVNDTETYYLVSNKSKNGVLIEEQKHVDFWLKIESLNQTAPFDLVKNIKSIKDINLAFVVDPNSLKSKQKLISFDTESDECIKLDSEET